MHENVIIRPSLIWPSYSIGPNEDCSDNRAMNPITSSAIIEFSLSISPESSSGPSTNEITS